MLYTHYYAFIVIGWQAVLTLYRYRMKQKAGITILVLLLVLISFLPWLISGHLNIGGIPGFSLPGMEWRTLNDAYSTLAGESIAVRILLGLGFLSTLFYALKTKKYFMYCDTGRRSSTATYLLSENGFEAYVLKEGINGIDNDKLVS